MKKIIAILILCLLFACSIFVKPNHFTLKDYFDTGILHIYTKRPINETSLCLTNIYMSSNPSGATDGDIIGESLYFTNLEVGSALQKLRAQVKITEYRVSTASKTCSFSSGTSSTMTSWVAGSMPSSFMAVVIPL